MLSCAGGLFPSEKRRGVTLETRGNAFHKRSKESVDMFKVHCYLSSSDFRRAFRGVLNDFAHRCRLRLSGRQRFTSRSMREHSRHQRSPSSRHSHQCGSDCNARIPISSDTNAGEDIKQREHVADQSGGGSGFESSPAWRFFPCLHTTDRLRPQRRRSPSRHAHSPSRRQRLDAHVVEHTRDPRLQLVRAQVHGVNP